MLPSPLSIITTDLTTASVGLPPCLQVQPLEGFDLFGVQDPKSLLLAFLNILGTSASFWRTYTKPLKTANPAERWISILQPLAVSCDHSNSSYTETSSGCCNYPLGQGRDHMLKSSTETAVFRLTDRGEAPEDQGEGRSLSHISRQLETLLHPPVLTRVPPILLPGSSCASLSSAPQLLLVPGFPQG